MIFRWHLLLLTLVWIVSVQSFSFFGLFKSAGPHQSAGSQSPQPPSKSAEIFSIQGIKSLSKSSKAVYLSSTSSLPIPSSQQQHESKKVSAPKQSSTTSENQQSSGISLAATPGQQPIFESETQVVSHLPYLPANLTTLKQLQYRPNTSLSGPRALQKALSPEQEAQLNLAHYTATDLSCYIAPPLGTIVDMNKLMGLWTLVRKVNSPNGTDENYVCEKIVYTATGPNTFDKIADVHYGGKFQTIKGNGTFLSPGIMILDWRDLKDISKPDRLVFTVIATDYTEFVVGYDCHTRHRPEVVLETRRTVIPMEILNQAYTEIKATGLTLSDMVCQVGFTNSYMSSSISKKEVKRRPKKGANKGTKKGDKTVTEKGIEGIKSVKK